MASDSGKAVHPNFDLSTAGTNRFMVLKVEKKGAAIGVELSTTGGGAPTGTFAWFGSNSVDPDAAGGALAAGNGQEVAVTADVVAAALAGADATTGATFRQFPWQYLIGKYVRTSGTGTLRTVSYSRQA